MKIEIKQGDCLELMKDIPDGSVDMILADLPYETTNLSWDTIIPFEPLWEQYERVIKDNGAIVLTASQPFTSALITSNQSLYKYNFVWQKSACCNFVHAKNMPLKLHEDICVFSKAPIGHISQLGDRRMIYNPQGLKRVNKIRSRPKHYENGHKLSRESHKLERVIEFVNYPTSILKYNNSDNRERGLHPTQKPVALFEYLIKTYTNEGETVLDNVMGSFTTAIACLNTKRNFIGIELDKNYFKIGSERLEKHLETLDYKPEIVFNPE